MRLTARVLLERRGLVLAVIHGGKPHKIGLPGGRLDPGEFPHQTAARELHEETGLRLVGLAPLAVIDSKNRRTWYFVGEATGRVRSSSEGPARWVQPAELLAGKHGAECAQVLRLARVDW